MPVRCKILMLIEIQKMTAHITTVQPGAWLFGHKLRRQCGQTPRNFATPNRPNAMPKKSVTTRIYYLQRGTNLAVQPAFSTVKVTSSAKLEKRVLRTPQLPIAALISIVWACSSSSLNMFQATNKERSGKMRMLSPVAAVQAWLDGAFGIGEEPALTFAIRKDTRITISDGQITDATFDAMDEGLDAPACLKRLPDAAVARQIGRPYEAVRDKRNQCKISYSQLK